MKYVITSDIHGCWRQLKYILEDVVKEETQLIVLGDLVDRGPDSFSVVSHLMNAVKEDGVIVLKGNHEAMFLSFLDDPINEYQLYLGNGGWQTIKSFLPDAVYPIYDEDIEILAKRMLDNYPEEITFLRNLPLYHETDDWIFVHAGINTNLKDWKSSSEQDFLWIREAFHYGKNETGKTIFFGHTPTQMMNPSKSNDPIVFACGTKIAIDGAAAFGGQLNVVFLDDEAPSDMSFMALRTNGMLNDQNVQELFNHFL